MAAPTQCYLLDGTGDYISLADNAGFDVDTYVSIGLWIHRDYDNLDTITGLFHRASSYSVWIDSDNKVVFEISGAEAIKSKGTIPAEKEIFIVCTAEESGSDLIMKIYLGGLLDTSQTILSATMAAANANVIAIGSLAAGASPLKGTISSIFMTSDAVTAAEVNSIWSSTSGQITDLASADNEVIDIDCEGDLVNAGTAGNGTAQGNAALRTYMSLQQSAVKNGGTIVVPEAETGYRTSKRIVMKSIRWEGENIADGDVVTLKTIDGGTPFSYHALAADEGGYWAFDEPIWNGLHVYALGHGKLEIEIG
jgi:hypothetical protein